MKKLFRTVLFLIMVAVVSFAATNICLAGWFGPGQGSWSDNFMGLSWNVQGGYSGAGWNGGYWRGPNNVPDVYPKNQAGWGRLNIGGYGVAAGAGYGGGGFSIQAPGIAPIGFGW